MNYYLVTSKTNPLMWGLVEERISGYDTHGQYVKQGWRWKLCSKACGNFIPEQHLVYTKELYPTALQGYKIEKLDEKRFYKFIANNFEDLL